MAGARTCECYGDISLVTLGKSEFLDGRRSNRDLNFGPILLVRTKLIDIFSGISHTDIRSLLPCVEKVFQSGH